MKNLKSLQQAFGLNENGMIDFPIKISNIKISRFINFKKQGGCDRCFPHGIDCNNNQYAKDIKYWKRYRKTQYKK